MGLRQHHPGLAVELVRMSTRGDRILDAPLARVGGKGLFLKELEEALLAGAVDIAVHSMKDVTIELPAGLHIAAICERDSPFDALVANHHDSLDALPAGARIGTSSLRRQCQLRARLPRCVIEDLRGNVNTRLGRLDRGDFEAIILAAAGLRRLNLEHRITALLPARQCLPAVGQGAVGIECRRDDERINALLAPLDDAATHTCLRAERALNARLQGGCQVPIGAYAELVGDRLRLRALVGRPDGREILRDEPHGPVGTPVALGKQLADRLLARGAGRILKELHDHASP